MTVPEALLCTAEPGPCGAEVQPQPAQGQAPLKTPLGSATGPCCLQTRVCANAALGLALSRSETQASQQWVEARPAYLCSRFSLSLCLQTAQRKIREIVQQVKQQEQKHAQGAPSVPRSK